MKYLPFNKNKDVNGYMSNMYPSEILYNNLIWPSAEHLFQALRYNDIRIQGLIRREKSPMRVKAVAKMYSDQRVIRPLSNLDVRLMETVVWLKFEQNKEMSDLLVNSGYGTHYIYENVEKRIGDFKSSALFWGAFLKNDAYLIGMNILGIILMRYRFCKMNDLKLNEIEHINLNNLNKKWV